MTSGELASQLGYSLAGKSDIKLSGIAYAIDAKINEVAIVYSKNELEKTNSEIALLKPSCVFSNKTLIFTHEPLALAMVKTAHLLVKNGICYDYGCSDSLCQEKQFWKGDNVKIGKKSCIGVSAVIHSNVHIGENSSIGDNTIIHSGTRIGSNVKIGSNCCIGADALYRYYENDELKQFAGIGKVAVGNHVNIGNSVNIQRGTLSTTYIGENTMIGNFIDIGHDVSIGKNCFIVSQTGIAGNTQIGNRVTLYGQVSVVGNVKIGNNVIVHAKSLVTKDIIDFQEVSGNPARNHRDELRVTAKNRQKNKEF